MTHPENSPSCAPVPSSTSDFSSITDDELKAFCKAMELDFSARGCPPGVGGTGWDDPSVFRVGTHEHPSRGITIHLSRVLEWRRAVQSMRSQVDEVDQNGNRSVCVGGMYQHYKGGIYTVIGRATQESSGAPVVLYNDANGRAWVRPEAEFFDVLLHEGRMVARFTPQLIIRLVAA